MKILLKIYILSIQKMKLECVLTATNTHPRYIHFIPIFIKTWRKLYKNIDIKIILVAEELPLKFTEFSDHIILFPPLPDIDTGFQSQYIRLLFPALFTQYKNGILITDIDMLPMNKTYYTKPIEPIPDSKFIHMRGSKLERKKQVCICYNIATATTWRDITGIRSLKDIIKCFQKLQSEQSISWFKDQEDLYQYLTRWNAKTQNWVKLTDAQCGFKRLNRGHFDIRNFHIRKAITNHEYSDYHCLRPMTEYSKINSRIYYLL